MAYKGKVIFNPKTGHQIRFLQTARDTGGQLLEMESTYYGHSKEPALHFHPAQNEEFTVKSGVLTLKLNGENIQLKSGDTVFIPMNAVHAMWNDTNEETVVNWKVWPALDTEYLLETMSGLAADGKVGANGLPAPLQLITTANRYRNTLRLAKPSALVQGVLFCLLTPVAKLFGYAPFYKKYID